MTFDEIEELIRKYLSAGITAIVIIVSPNAAGNGDTTPEPDARVIEPQNPSPAGTGNRAPAAPDRTGAGRGDAGQDPVPDDEGDVGDTTDRPPSRSGGTGAGSRDPGVDSGSAGNSESGRGSGTDSSRSGPGGSAGRTDSTSGSAGTGRDSNGSADGETGAGSRAGASGGSTGRTDADSSASGSSGRDGTGSRNGNGSGSRDSASAPSDSESGSGSGGRSSRGSDGTGGGTDEDTTDGNGSVSGSGSGSGSGRDSGSATGDTGTRSAPSAADAGAEATTDEGVTAAERFGWGTPDREDDFSDGLDGWNLYDGPGHAGNGTRSPAAATVRSGVLTITGDSSGTTAGMAWNPGQRYGRWEGRVKAPASDPSYHALLLLWPDAENFPVGGEIDFMEMLDHTRQVTDIFVHYGEDNSQVNGQVEVDATEWHNWAVEWTPEAITAYVDGEEWYRTTDTSIFPPGPMHLCIQLDWFPEGDSPQESYMYVDWVRQYSLDETSGTDDTSADSTTADADTGGTDGDGSDGSDDSGRDTATRLGEAIRRLFFWR